ncbi:probable E3 ubiquitin-protein ligase HIP1 isoform X2 [Phalaenopsis equestris]|uniref:probable E3 ubiquitin-protein ligase HIP1 isoform X2 n=1 Tax=Phalaenopsis equestris TaxID=78828 RepID=UPI0009E19805|nr:probable E3 ubiquitin-protein ligase HIP1 isoform X2 [Phalaenopsis equestris]
MDQPLYGSNMLLNSVETSTLAEYLLSPNETDMDYLNIAPRETDGLNIWNSSDPNSSSYIINQENHDAIKMDHGWSTSLSISSSSDPTMEERNNILSLEHVDLNLNNSPADDGQAFTQRLNSTHENHRMDQNVHGDPRGEIMGPFLPEIFEPQHVPYSNSIGSSSSGVGKVLEDVDRARSLVDSQRVACKRKSMEAFVGESSTSHNISADLGMPSSSRYLPATSFVELNQSPGFTPAMHRGVCSERNPTSCLLGNAETLQRNIRARLNPACQHDMSPFQSQSTATGDRLPSIWSSSVDPSSILSHFNHAAEQTESRMLIVPGLPHNISNPSSASRIGSSSLPAYPQRRLISSPEEANIRSLTRNGVVDQQTYVTRNTASHLSQDPLNWNPSNSSLSVPGNRASISSGIVPSPGSIRTSSEMVPVQYHRNSSEVLRSSLFLSGGSESGHQTNNLSSRQSGRFASMQEPGQSSRNVRQGHPPLYPRAAFSIDRQRDGVSGLPLSARSRDGRSRMISEIRNALDLMRRGVNLRFEDVFLFDQSGFYGRADLYDRHRDMRLDVDNMSYEELLALEERIGYVSTGLNEETILKSLRQRKYSPCNLEVASTEQEPCCICREDYGEGEGIGTLDCKHDFHTDCIKQWLMIKNLCPICKTTALVT